MSKPTIGVLALQGAFAKHLESLQKIGVNGLEVRHPRDLSLCDGLIIPGGESTTILKNMWFIELFEEIKSFSQTKPIFGTCAGLILMSKTILGNDSMQPFGLLDIAVERNAFGRQVESFIAPVEAKLDNGKPMTISAMFIRAPRIRSCGNEVRVLAAYENEPTLVQQGIHLGATFHPELTQQTTVHEFFLSLVSRKNS